MELNRIPAADTKADPYTLSAVNFYPAAYKIVAGYSMTLARFGIDPEDMVQRMIFRLWRVESKYDPDVLIKSGRSTEKVKATTYAHMILTSYLNGIIAGEKRKADYRKGVQVYNNQEAVDDKGVIAGLDSLSTFSFTEEKLSIMEFKETIAQVSRGLPSKHKRVLELRMQGKSLKDIEYALGYEYGTVKQIMSTLRYRLDKYLKKVSERPV